MPRDLDSAPLHRCIAVWALATTTLAALAGWLVPDLAVALSAATEGRVGFADALVQVSEGVLLGCAAWAWAVTGIVTSDAARGRPASRSGVSSGLRRMVLVACGAALVSTLAVPAHAGTGTATSDRSTPGAVLRGLPLPDRATAADHGTRRPAPPPAEVVVRPGDTLWALAVADLSPGADDAAVSRRAEEIYRANRTVIGPNPDLIQPDQRLRLPRP